MGINSVNASGSVTPSFNSNSVNNTNNITSANVDNLSTYSSEIANGKEMTVGGFTKIILAATNHANQTSWAIQQSNAIATNSLYQSNVEIALYLARVFQVIYSAAIKYSKAYVSDDSNVISLNFQINSYNRGVGQDASNTAALNSATNTYNTAVGVFNAAVAKRQQVISTYIQAFNAYNSYLPGPVPANVNLTYQLALIAFNNEQGTFSAATSAINSAYSTYLQAVSTYNGYASNRNSTINDTNNSISSFENETNANNQLVTQTNLEFNSIGASSLASQSLYSPTRVNLLPIVTPTSPNTSGNVNVSTVNTLNPNPSSNLSLETNTMDIKGISASALADELYGPLYLLLSGLLGVAEKIAANQTDYSEFQQFYLQGKAPFLPASFITQKPNPALGSSGNGIGSGSGVSLASLIASLSNPLLEAIISQGMFSSNTALASFNSATNITTQIQNFGAQFFPQASLLAGGAAANLLKNQLTSLDLNSPGVNAVVAQALANEITQAISSGVVQNGIQKILAQAYPGLSPDELNNLSSQASAATELVLLQAGLLQLGQALQNPQLSGQVLSTLSATQQLGTFSPASSASAVLNNSNSLAAIQASASTNLADEANIQYSQAQQIVAQGINEAYVNGQLNEQAYVSSLVQSGISQEYATENANNLQAYLQSEIISQGVLENSVASNRLSQSILSNELVNQIVSAQPDITNRQLRDKLVNQFIANGATYQEAISSATTAVTGNPIAAGSVSLENLSNSLYTSANHLTSNVGFNATESQAFANQLVSTVIGPDIPGSQTSIRSLMDQRLNLLVQLQDTNVTAEAKDNLQNFLAPTLELSKFAELLNNPANTFLLSAQTGIMYSHNEPNNYRRSVDISV